MSAEQEWNSSASISQAHHVLHNTLGIISCSLIIKGHLEPTRMRNALTYVMTQHPALCTRFVIAGQTVKREFFNPSSVPLPILFLKKFLSFAALRPFVEEFSQIQRENLPKRNQGPLFNCAFIQYEINKTLILVTIDHIICDAWSIKLLTDALFKAYEEAEAPLKIEPAEDLFADFILWQKNKINHSKQRIAEVWAPSFIKFLPLNDKLRQEPEALIKQEITFSKETTQALELAAIQAKISVFTYLLTAFKLFLADLKVCSSPIRMVHSGRFKRKWRSVIGLFASSLWVDIPVDKATTFAGLLKIVHQSIYRTIKWSYVPVEYIESLGNSNAAPMSKIEIDYMPLDLFNHPDKLLQVTTLLDWTLSSLQPDLDMQLLGYHQNNQLCLFFIAKKSLLNISQPQQALINFKNYILQLIEQPQTLLSTMSNSPYSSTDEKNTISS